MVARVVAGPVSILAGPALVLAVPAFECNLLSVKAGLDPNVRFSQRSHHILLSLMDMVQNARSPKDLNFVYSLTLTLLQVILRIGVLIGRKTLPIN